MNRAAALLVISVTSVILCGLVLPLPRSAHAQKPAAQADAFFASGPVLHLTIDVEPKDVQMLNQNPRKYVKATLTEGDKVYKDIGIHLKGAAGSFHGFDGKPGLTLNMDKFGVDQRFHGLEKFHLANSVQDPSYISELLCGELFRAAGVPAARVAHAFVTLNGKRRGLYYLKEGYDRDFLKRNFGNADGNFYDGGFLRELNQPLHLLSTKNDVKDQADLKKVFAAASEKDVKLRFARMEKVIDMDKFISYLVLEVITWDWDGYPMNRNNYRIYHDPRSDKITFIPSGMDQMFGNPTGPLFPGFQGVVARAVLETPEGRTAYLARMEEVLRKNFDLEALNKRLDELQARIQPALASINAGLGTGYPPQVQRLRDAIKTRHKSLLDQLRQVKK